MLTQLLNQQGFGTGTALTFSPPPVPPPAHVPSAGGAGPLHVVVVMRGWNVLQQHFYAYSYLIGEMTYKLLGVLQMYMTYAARNLLMPHYRTGALMGSITPVDKSGNGTNQAVLVQWQNGDMFAQVGAGGTVMSGPMTGGVAEPQSYLLEYGFNHVRSGRFIRYPFMGPALDMAAGPFVDGMVSIAYLADGFTVPIAGPASATLAQSITKYRTMLYSYSRAMGDIQVFTGGIQIMSTFRSGILRAAKGLGDLNALMKASIATRVEARMFGAFTQSMGRFNLSTTGTGFSDMGNRIFNRFSGHTYGLGLRELIRIN